MLATIWPRPWFGYVELAILVFLWTPHSSRVRRRVQLARLAASVRLSQCLSYRKIKTSMTLPWYFHVSTSSCHIWGTKLATSAAVQVPLCELSKRVMKSWRKVCQDVPSIAAQWHTICNLCNTYTTHDIAWNIYPIYPKKYMESMPPVRLPLKEKTSNPWYSWSQAVKLAGSGDYTTENKAMKSGPASILLQLRVSTFFGQLGRTE